MKKNQILDLVLCLLFTVCMVSCQDSSKFVGVFSASDEENSEFSLCEIDLESKEPTIEFALDDEQKGYGYFRYDNLGPGIPKIASYNIVEIIEKKGNKAKVRCVNDRCDKFDGIWEILLSEDGKKITFKLLEEVPSKEGGVFCDSYGPSEFVMTKDEKKPEADKQ